MKEPLDFEGREILLHGFSVPELESLHLDVLVRVGVSQLLKGDQGFLIRTEAVGFNISSWRGTSTNDVVLGLHVEGLQRPFLYVEKL